MKADPPRAKGSMEATLPRLLNSVFIWKVRLEKLRLEDNDNLKEEPSAEK